MKAGYESGYAELYRRHWWWRAREQFLLREIRALRLPAGIEILDVGCGNGLFFSELARFGYVRGIEVGADLLDETGPHRKKIFTAPLGDPQYAGWKFALITALDVVEHIEDDRAAVQHIETMLKPGGHLLLTVPAFMELWDEHDELNQHQRRYRASEVQALLAPAFEIVDLRYWFHGLYLAKRVVSVVNRRREHKIIQHKIPPPAVNRGLRALLEWENLLLSPLRLPFGSSVMAIGRKR